MYPKSIVERTMQELFRQAMRNTDNLRKSETAKKLDYFNNLQQDYILDALRQNHPQTFANIAPVNLNVVSRIIRALSMVYLQDATRKVEGTDRDAEIYANFEDTAALPVKLKLANRLTKLLGNVLLRPVWRNGKPDLDVLTGDIVDVQYGDSPDDLKAVLVTLYDASGDVTEVQYSLWTAEEYRLLNYSGATIHAESNPYGRLPFVAIWNTPPLTDFWVSGALHI